MPIKFYFVAALIVFCLGVGTGWKLFSTKNDQDKNPVIKKVAQNQRNDCSITHKTHINPDGSKDVEILLSASMAQKEKIVQPAQFSQRFGASLGLFSDKQFTAGIEIGNVEFFGHTLTPSLIFKLDRIDDIKSGKSIGVGISF